MPHVVRDGDNNIIAVYNRPQANSTFVAEDNADLIAYKAFIPPAKQLASLITQAEILIADYWEGQVSSVGNWPIELQIQVAELAAEFVQIVNALTRLRRPIADVQLKAIGYIDALPTTFTPNDTEDDTVYTIAPLKTSLLALLSGA